MKFKKGDKVRSNSGIIAIVCEKNKDLKIDNTFTGVIIDLEEYTKESVNDTLSVGDIIPCFSEGAFNLL